MKFLDLYDKPLTPNLEKGYIINCTPEQLNEARSIDLFTIDTENTAAQKETIILNIKSSSLLREAIFDTLHKEIEFNLEEEISNLLINYTYTGDSIDSDICLNGKKEYETLVEEFEIFTKYDVREPKVSQLMFDKILSEVLIHLKYEDIVCNKKFNLPDFKEFIDNIKENTNIQTHINILRAKAKCNYIRSLRSPLHGFSPQLMSPSEINSLRELGYVLGAEVNSVHIENLDDAITESFIFKNFLKISNTKMLEKLNTEFSYHSFRIDEELSNEIFDFIYFNVQDHIEEAIKEYSADILNFYIQIKASSAEQIKSLKKRRKKLLKSLADNDYSNDLENELLYYVRMNVKYKDALAFIKNDLLQKHIFFQEIFNLHQVKHAIEVSIIKLKISFLNDLIEKDLGDFANLKTKKHISPANKAKIENINTKLANFDSLFKDNDKEFALSMLEELAITRGGHSILTNRKKSRLRGFVEALVEYHIIPDDNIDNLCEIFANQIGMEYKARLKCSDISEKTKKSTIDYIKKHH